MYLGPKRTRGGLGTDENNERGTLLSNMDNN